MAEYSTTSKLKEVFTFKTHKAAKRKKNYFIENEAKKRMSISYVPDGTQHSVKLNGFVNEDVL